MQFWPARQDFMQWFEYAFFVMLANHTNLLETLAALHIKSCLIIHSKYAGRGIRKALLFVEYFLKSCCTGKIITLDSLWCRSVLQLLLSGFKIGQTRHSSYWWCNIHVRKTYHNHVQIMSSWWQEYYVISMSILTCKSRHLMISTSL
jgi:hypothetical protein